MVTDSETTSTTIISGYNGGVEPMSSGVSGESGSYNHKKKHSFEVRLQKQQWKETERKHSRK